MFCWGYQGKTNSLNIQMIYQQQQMKSVLKKEENYGEAKCAEVQKYSVFYSMFITLLIAEFVICFFDVCESFTNANYSAGGMIS